MTDCHEEDIESASQMLIKHQKNHMIFVGGGADISGAAERINKNLSKRVDAPVT